MTREAPGPFKAIEHVYNVHPHKHKSESQALKIPAGALLSTDGEEALHIWMTVSKRVAIRISYKVPPEALQDGRRDRVEMRGLNTLRDKIAKLLKKSWRMHNIGAMGIDKDVPGNRGATYALVRK